jgi:quercetin dioxygenase-like cupin family protein
MITGPPPKFHGTRDILVLKPGDSFVTRGVKHSWSNRTDKPVVLVCLQSGAKH